MTAAMPLPREAKAAPRLVTDFTGSSWAIALGRLHQPKGSEMNWDIVEGKWHELKGKAQSQWGKLTNDDLDIIDGRREELAGRIQARYGVARDEAERQIDEWMSRR